MSGYSIFLRLQRYSDDDVAKKAGSEPLLIFDFRGRQVSTPWVITLMRAVVA